MPERVLGNVVKMETAVKQITLEDCILELDTFHEEVITLTLPVPIDMSRAEAYRNPNFCDHYHYKNMYGDLNVACDGFARFWAASICGEFVNHPLRYNFDFESTAPVSSAMPHKFRLWEDKMGLFSKEDTRETILAKIKSHT